MESNRIGVEHYVRWVSNQELSRVSRHINQQSMSGYRDRFSWGRRPTFPGEPSVFPYFPKSFACVPPQKKTWLKVFPSLSIVLGIFPCFFFAHQNLAVHRSRCPQGTRRAARSPVLPRSPGVARMSPGAASSEASSSEPPRPSPTCPSSTCPAKAWGHRFVKRECTSKYFQEGWMSVHMSYIYIHI